MQLLVVKRLTIVFGVAVRAFFPTGTAVYVETKLHDSRGGKNTWLVSLRLALIRDSWSNPRNLPNSMAGQRLATLLFSALFNTVPNALLFAFVSFGNLRYK